MLADERQSLILNEINSRGSVSTAELISAFNVSPITVRRDLSELDALGLISKVHGGARSIRATNNPTYAQKSQINLEAKKVLAQAAAKYVQDGDSIGLAAGSTCATIAAEISKRKNLTVITNSIRVADQFQASLDTNLLVTGGQRTPSEALVGPLTIAALENLHFDTLFTSTHGASHKAGLTSPSVEEANAVRALIKSANRVIQVFDHTKWGINNLSTFAQWEEIDTVIIDDGAPETLIHDLQELVAEVVIAS